MKTLKTKKVNLVICWNGLRNTSPKDFPNIAEMEKTMDILAILKKGAGEFVELIKKGEDMNTELQNSGIKGEQVMAKRAEFQKESNELEAKKGKDVVKVEFEDDFFSIFCKQFERWGRNWFFKLEPYLEFRKDLLGDQAQSEPEEENGAKPGTSG